MKNWKIEKRLHEGVYGKSTHLAILGLVDKDITGATHTHYISYELGVTSGTQTAQEYLDEIYKSLASTVRTYVKEIGIGDTFTIPGGEFHAHGRTFMLPEQFFTVDDDRSLFAHHHVFDESSPEQDTPEPTTHAPSPQM